MSRLVPVAKIKQHLASQHLGVVRSGVSDLDKYADDGNLARDRDRHHVRGFDDAE